MNISLNKATIYIIMTAGLLTVPGVPVMAEEAPGDIRFEREGEEEGASPFPPSIFQHWLHRARYRCDACHDSLFKMELGATPVTMQLIGEGKACGACHNGINAFASTFENCNRCHRQDAD